MRPTITNYLQNADLHNFPVLIGEDCIRELARMQVRCGEVRAPQAIYEVQLGEAPKTADFSYKVESGRADVKDHWYEYDFEEYAEGGAFRPCVFSDASCLVPGADGEAVQYFYETELPDLVGAEKATLITPALQRLITLLDGKCESLFQVGTMDSRKPSESVRIYTESMSGENVLLLLQELGWTGNPAAADSVMQAVGQFTQGFMLSFDLFPDHISRKIGIEFQPPTVYPEAQKMLFALLTEKGWCQPEKQAPLFRWITEPPIAAFMMQKDISHIKFSIDGDAVSAKAYLRQISEYGVILPFHRILKFPERMELALVRGEKVLPPAAAAAWIERAAQGGVCTVWFAGQELAAYPEAALLLTQCRAHNLQTAVWFPAEQMPDNPPACDEIHALLALTPERAAALPELLASLESSGLKAVTITMPEPCGGLHLPDAEQMQAAANCIRHYSGTMQIEVDSCFSQLRALVLRRVFRNDNWGIFRGCGAGRTRIAVNADGKLVPCRYLDRPEETESVEAYWNESPVLQQLRADDAPPASCKGCVLRRNCQPCAAACSTEQVQGCTLCK